jgi:hypothetical protein
MPGKISALLLSITSLCHIALCQNSFLSGIVTMDGVPEAGVKVYTSFCTTTSDDLGRYSINLNLCKECRPGTTLMLYTHKPDITSGIHTVTLGNDRNQNIQLIRNRQFVNIIGMTIDERLNIPLEGITVNLIVGDIETSPCKTDSFGIFRIKIPRYLVADVSSVLLLANDEKSKYISLTNNPSFYAMGSFVKIPMQFNPFTKIIVKGLTNPGICFKEGDLIEINAIGRVTFIDVVAISGPSGRQESMIGVEMEPKSINSTFARGALLYRLTGDADWKLAGDKKMFIASRDGCIEFQINDKQMANNTGGYEVSVLATRQ